MWLSCRIIDLLVCANGWLRRSKCSWHLACGRQSQRVGCQNGQLSIGKGLHDYGQWYQQWETCSGCIWWSVRQPSRSNGVWSWSPDAAVLRQLVSNSLWCWTEMLFLSRWLRSRVRFLSLQCSRDCLVASNLPCFLFLYFREFYLICSN